MSQPNRLVEVAYLSYYHTFNSYLQIRDKFLPYLKKDGYFLLRNSLTSNQCTISVVHQNELKHMKVEERNGSYTLQDAEFPSLDQLMKYYSEHDIPNKEGVLHVRLLYPISVDNYARPSAELVCPPAIPSLPRRHSDGIESTYTRLYATGNNESGPYTSPAFGGAIGGGRIPNRATNYSAPSKKGEKMYEAIKPARHSLPPDLTHRAPAVLPRHVREAAVPAPANPKPPDFCYDYARIVDHLHEVKEQVRLMDLEDSGYCHCGLKKVDSHLPLNWALHMSTEPATNGRIFFVSPSNVSTWELPQDVDELLTTEQRMFITKIKQKQPSP